MSLELKAKPGGCGECVMGAPFYIPCNKPAVCIVYWEHSTEEVPMCAADADHNVRNRGAKRKDLP